MPRSSKLEPELQVLVDQAERARLAIEAMVDLIEPKHSRGFCIETFGDGRSGRCNHERFTCAGKDALWSREDENGWCGSAEAAADALISAVGVLLGSGDVPREQRKLVWRKTPEVRSITAEIGDLFNANCRLSVVPVDWVVSFPEDDEAPVEQPLGVE